MLAWKEEEGSRALEEEELGKKGRRKRRLEREEGIEAVPMLSRTFLKEVRVLVERRDPRKTVFQSSPSLSPSPSPSEGWNFGQFIGDKLEHQVERQKNLPTLNALVDSRLEQLLPLYAHLLDTGKDDSVHGHMLKFMAPSSGGGGGRRAAKLNNLKAHIIKYEIHREYFEVSEFRRSKLSITVDPEVSSEMLVHTYTDKDLIQFVKLLHDETFLNSSYYNYYRRFSRLFFNIVEGGNGESGANAMLSRKLRPTDLERMLQQLLYSNKRLRTEERLELRLDEMNIILLNDLQEAGLKLSNKEMFALLQLTFRKTVDLRNVKMLYEKFMGSDKFDKNGDFFKAFLNFNMSLGFSNERMASAEFCRKVILDLVRSDDVAIDRHLLKYLLKYSWIVHDGQMTRLVATYLLEHYAVDVETFNMIFVGVLRHDTSSNTVSPVLEQLLNINLKHTMRVSSLASSSSVASRIAPPPVTEAERFNMRLLDHLLEKAARVSPQMQPLCPGIVHRLPLNTVPHDLLLRATQNNIDENPVVKDYLRRMSRAEAEGPEGLQHRLQRRHQGAPPRRLTPDLGQRNM